MSAVSPTADVAGSGGNRDGKGPEDVFFNLPFSLTLVSTTALGFCLLSAPCPEEPARPGFGERLLTDELVETGPPKLPLRRLVPDSVLLSVL